MAKGKVTKKETKQEPQGKNEDSSVCTITMTTDTAVLLLPSHDPEVLRTACDFISKSAGPGNENELTLDLGAVKRILELASHDDKHVRQNAIVAIANLASNGNVKNMLKELDVVPTMIGQLSPDAQEEEVIRQYATLCLAKLSEDDGCSQSIFREKGLEVLIPLLSSPNTCINNSLEIIFNMIQKHPPSLEKLHQLGGVVLYVDLLKSDNPAIQMLTLKILRSFIVHGFANCVERSQQIIEEVMVIVSCKVLGDIHVVALEVIGMCACDKIGFDLLQKCGGLKRLLELVSTPDLPEIHCATLECFIRMSQYAVNRQVLHENHLETVLVQLLSAVDDRVKTCACYAIQAMSPHHTCMASLRELDGINVMLQLLQQDCVELREAAVQTLCKLMPNYVNAMALRDADGFRILVERLSDSCAAVVIHTAETLIHLAEHTSFLRGILSQGAMAALVEPMKGSDVKTLATVTKCLVQLACDVPERSEFQKAGGLAALLNVLRCRDKDVQRYACWTVAVFAKDEPAAVEMVNIGIFELVLEIKHSASRSSEYSEIALSRLFDSHLPMKYSLTGRLSSTDIIKTGFYDTVKVPEQSKLPTLEELAKENLHIVYCVNMLTPKPEENKTEVDQPEPEINLKKKRRALKSADSSKRKATKTPQQEKPWEMPIDTNLQLLVTTARELLLSHNSERDQYAALARLVSEAMGGPVEREMVNETQWDLKLQNIISETGSMIIPIGSITMGNDRHRALLFKTIVDQIGLCCTLEKDKCNRAWNEVLLPQEGLPKFQRCIVDLMHEPGNFKRINPFADLYTLM